MRDLTNRKVVKDLEKRAAIDDRQDGVTISKLMDTMAGRSFVHRKLIDSHVFSTSFSLNALQMAFNEGERNIGLKLLTDIMKHCPDKYILMEREAYARDTATEQRSSTLTDRGDTGTEPDYEDPSGSSRGDEDEGRVPITNYQD